MKTSAILFWDHRLGRPKAKRKRWFSSESSARAFTLIELLVVIAIIAILAAILLPVLAAAKAHSLEAQCLNNEKQLITGWVLYGTDNDDYMVPNSPYGYAANQSWCPNEISGCEQDWGTQRGNTNAAYYNSTILAPYMSQQLGVYRCPADIWNSRNGNRLRDYSMQSQVGNLYCKATTLNDNPNGIPYKKVTDLRSAPGPADTIVFLEEHPNSLLLSPSGQNGAGATGVYDGYLEVDSKNGTFPDVPGSMHRWGNGISFADGHAEIHIWLKPGAVTATSITTLRIPVTPNGNSICGLPVTETTTGIDWVWFTTHCSGINPTPGQWP